MPGPLEGIKVIDVSAILSGPMATMLLADQGADVIKVEPPGIGDFMRVSPFRRGDMGAFFVNGNRGKRSIVIDVKQSEGRDLLLRLCEGADVFVQNFRPGAAERLGIAEADVRKASPDIIYVSISGFGETGPYSGRRVYDPIIQALTGSVSIQKHPDGGDLDLVRHVVCDKASALTAAQAVTAALFARTRGAGGQHIRVAMIDAALFFFWPDGMMSHTFVGDGVEPGPTISQLYRLTNTADGHLICFAASDSEFAGLFRALGHPEWVEDERYSTVQGRIDNRLELEALVLEAFRNWKTDEILARLEAEVVPAAPVHSLDAVLEDPQVLHNQSIVEMEIPGAGRIRQPASPARFDKTPASATRAAPRLGEHSDEILAEHGIQGKERERLRSEGVVP